MSQKSNTFSWRPYIHKDMLAETIRLTNPFQNERSKSMFVYFGYFGSNRSVYVIVREEEIPLKYFRLTQVDNYKGSACLSKPVLNCSYEEHIRLNNIEVYNLNTKNNWFLRKTNNDFILVNPWNTPYGGEASRFLDSKGICTDDIISIDKINNHLRRNEKNERYSKVYNAGIQGMPPRYVEEPYDEQLTDEEHLIEVRSYTGHLEISNNIGEANQAGLNAIKENKVYPSIIVGNNIPKIKLDKELKYVKKINFEPISKRDYETIGE
jgi:hypothetical protein